MLAMLFPLSLRAVPATGHLYGVFSTKNGDSLRVKLMGDEHLSFWKSDDGRFFQLNKQQQLCEIY
jgi:hypothetical protein